jgi:hypothetical protein
MYDYQLFLHAHLLLAVIIVDVERTAAETNASDHARLHLAFVPSLDLLAFLQLDVVAIINVVIAAPTSDRTASHATGASSGSSESECL